MAEKRRVEAYSPETDTRYWCWDDMIEAEAHGWTVIAVITGKLGSVYPHSEGLFESKADAELAARRLRRQNKRASESHPKVRGYSVFVRPAWRSSQVEDAESRWHHAMEWLHRRGEKLMHKLDGHAHLTASRETKAEFVFIREELERQGLDLTRHCVRVRDGQGWRAVFFDLEGNVVRER